MSRMTLFGSPLFLGFDHLEQARERMAKVSAEGYPPYNIEQTGPDTLRITLAVAGFTMDELSITLEDNQLVVRGKQTDDSEGRSAASRPTIRRAACSSIAASPPGSSSAPSFSRKASR